MTTPNRRRSPIVVLCLIYLGFGMPIAMLGAGWPEARDQFGQSTGSLGMVGALYGIGRLVTSPIALPILRRWPIHRANTVLAVGLAASCALAGLTRSFPILVVAFGAIGTLTGCLDSLGNRYQTVVRSVGSAGLMFGAYGVGSTIGPAVVATTSWTTGYLVAAVVIAVAAVASASRSVVWPADLAAPARARATDHLTKPPANVLILLLVVFATYVGVEVVTANWAASYLESSEGLSGSGAAWAMSGFWAGMTLGRLSLGRLAASGRGIGSHQLLTGSAVAVAVIFVAIPFLPPSVAAVSFAVGGLALAGVFPTLMSTTADRVGVAAAGRTMGWQLLIANLAATGLNIGVGIGVDRIGPATPAVTVAVLAAVGLPLMLRTVSVHADGASATPAPVVPDRAIPGSTPGSTPGSSGTSP